MHVDIDYSPTDDLVVRPLRYCKNPDLRYDLKEISLYVDKADVVSIVRHLGAQRAVKFLGSIWNNDSSTLRSLDLDEAQAIILTERFSYIYLFFGELNWTTPESTTAKKERTFWKRHELIRLSSPLKIRMGSEIGSLWYIEYSNEFVEDGTIVKKGSDFREATEALLHWLNANFANWRGKLCFDNPAEHLRLFGDRFSQNDPTGRKRR